MEQPFFAQRRLWSILKLQLPVSPLHLFLSEHFYIALHPATSISIPRETCIDQIYFAKPIQKKESKEGKKEKNENSNSGEPFEESSRRKGRVIWRHVRGKNMKGTWHSYARRERPPIPRLRYAFTWERSRHRERSEVSSSCYHLVLHMCIQSVAKYVEDIWAFRKPNRLILLFMNFLISLYRLSQVWTIELRQHVVRWVEIKERRVRIYVCFSNTRYHVEHKIDLFFHFKVPFTVSNSSLTSYEQIELIALRISCLSCFSSMNALLILFISFSQEPVFVRYTVHFFCSPQIKV